MVRWIVPSVLAAMGLAAYAEEAAERGAPDFVLKSTSGSNLRLSEYRGQVVLVAFWGSWCGECRTQLQSFNELYGTFHDIGFELLSISLDGRLEEAAATASSLGLQFPVLHDRDGIVAERYEVDELPYVLLIDREGNVRDAIEGFNRTEEEGQTLRVRNLLRE